MPGYEVIGKEELNEVQDVFSNGGILCRQGFENLRNGCTKVKDFEHEFAKNMGAKNALAVTSGTAALRVALASLDIGPGDEVITQSFTFVATIEAIIEAGAIPVCTDIDETLNMDPKDLSNKITSKTKAVILVHMLGVPANLKEILSICQNHGLFLIEDTAWGCGGKFEGKALGTWGDIGTFSFDFAKTITTGEGGMIVFRENSIYKKAAAWHDHGHENNPKLPRWEDSRSGSGFNFRMMELQAAVGLAQLKKLKDVIESQRRNRDKIWSEISDIVGVQPRKILDGSYDTADALIFTLPNALAASNCRKMLLNVSLATKILPEAYTWHFAGSWSHMPELVGAHGGDLTSAFEKSNELLSCAVSLPIGVRMADNVPRLTRDAIQKALS